MTRPNITAQIAAQAAVCAHLGTDLTMARVNGLQPQVSRRLAAIDRLGAWHVQPQLGRLGSYWLAPRLKPMPVLPKPGPSPRERWEALRLTLPEKLRRKSTHTTTK